MKTFSIIARQQNIIKMHIDVVSKPCEETGRAVVVKVVALFELVMSLTALKGVLIT